MKQKLTGDGVAVIVSFKDAVWAPDGVLCRAALGPVWIIDEGETGEGRNLIVVGEERRQITVPLYNVTGVSDWPRPSKGGMEDLDSWKKARRLEGMYCGVFELSEWGLA